MSWNYKQLCIERMVMLQLSVAVSNQLKVDTAIQQWSCILDGSRLFFVFLSSDGFR